MFETASFHIIKACNMRCKFCYATFNDIKSRSLPVEDAKNILFKLKNSGLKKITFAGGEPLMYKNISEVICYSKAIGLTTSIITNGSLVDDDFIRDHIGVLDWIGLSIDSLSFQVNNMIGRYGMDVFRYVELIKAIKDAGYKLKINTVVNVFNQNENMQSFIDHANPSRWKIFDTLKVEGQNDDQYYSIKPNTGSFEKFVNRHHHKSMVVENNELMTGSYMLIDPMGRLFENSKGHHVYSSPLQHSDVDTCLSEISLDRNMFEKRGGIYDW